MATSSNQALLENHLVFTALQRGEVLRGSSAIQIQSHLPGFSCVLPLDDERNPEVRRLLDAHTMTRLLPWKAPSASAVEQRGFTPHGALSYMVLGDLPKPTARPAVEIERVTTAADMITFTAVQVAGFGDTGEEFDRWNKWLGEFNLRNLNHPDQTFLIARLDGRPVGVTLLVYTGKLAGIYAVATLPELRKRGVSTALLRHAVDEARQRGCTGICLQVVQGSYAQALYRSLGFTTAFDSPVFVRG